MSVWKLFYYLYDKTNVHILCDIFIITWVVKKKEIYGNSTCVQQVWYFGEKNNLFLSNKSCPC